jgi:ABC-type dipeptide/oligopeptide/nickel transport system permease subunit
MKRLILITTVAGAVLAVPALAQFGFGLTVFDPTSWGELVSQPARVNTFETPGSIIY